MVLNKINLDEVFFHILAAEFSAFLTETNNIKMANIIHFGYKANRNLEERLKEASTIIAKYPGRVPLILEKSTFSSIKPLDREKFIVKLDSTIHEFHTYLISK